MRESKFVDQNKEKWQQFELELKQAQKNPSKLRAQLIQITDDLSYARTYYKNRSVRIYLNGLAQLIYHSIYKNKSNVSKSIYDFFKTDVPKIVYYGRKEMLLSFVILIVSVLIGLFSSANDEQFARSIFGDDYINQTIKNIEKGDPLGIYKSSDAFGMFVNIATNNLRVSLFVFLFGLLFSYGAMVLMIRNGVMLGAFIYFFYSRNLIGEFNLTVWMHGSIEILTLVIETQAGMLLGRGLLYPGTLSRSKAFSVWGKRGAMLFLAGIPFIVFAAFVESFLTRFTEIPDVFRASFILLSIGLMVFYFVIYPYNKFKDVKDVDLGDADYKPDEPFEFDKNTIYSNGLIFMKSIGFFKKYLNTILVSVLLSSVLFFVCIAVFNFKETLSQFQVLSLDIDDLDLYNLMSKLGASYSNFGILLNSSESFIQYILMSVWQFGLLFFISKKLFKEFDMKAPSRKAIIALVLMVLSINLLLLLNESIILLLYLFMFPIALSGVFIYLMFPDRYSIMEGIKMVFQSGLVKTQLLSLTMAFISTISFVLLMSPISFLMVWVIELNVQLSPEKYTLLIKSILLLLFIFICSLLVSFQIVQLVLNALSIREINTANGLKTAISKLGNTKKVYGIETE